MLKKNIRLMYSHRAILKKKSKNIDMNVKFRDHSSLYNHQGNVADVPKLINRNIRETDNDIKVRYNQKQTEHNN